MAAKLKVFSWSDGFRAHTVATSSRAKALQAWGLNRDLFKDGYAREISEGADYDRALAEPGVVIDRGESIDPGKLRVARPPKPKSKAPATKAEKPKGPNPEDVQRVASLKDDLAELEKTHAAEIGDVAEKIEALETKRRDLQRDHARLRSDLKRKLTEAERRLRS